MGTLVDPHHPQTWQQQLSNNAPHSFHQITQRTSRFERYVLGVDYARRVAPYPLLYSRVLVPVVVKLKRSASSKGIRSFLRNQSPVYQSSLK